MNKPIRILLVTNGLILLAGAMLGPIYGLFVEEIGGDILDASYAYAVFALTAGITTLLSGRLSDRIKENEYILVFGYLVMAAGFVGYIFVESMLSLLIVQVIIGFGESIYSPAFDSIYSDHLDGHKFGQEWGAWEAINYFTTAFGAIAGGLLVIVFGFNGMFLAMAALSCISALYIFLLPRKLL